MMREKAEDVDFRDNPNLGDGNKIITSINNYFNQNFRDNPNLGDGNLVSQCQQRRKKA